MLPSESAAEAVMLTVAGAVYWVLLAGAVKETAGEALPAALTTMDMGEEVVTAFRLS